MKRPRSGSSRHGNNYKPCLLELAFVRRKLDRAILNSLVADYTPEQVADRKIKREKTGDMSLHLKPTRDIAARTNGEAGRRAD